MTWARLDDQLYNHPKLAYLGHVMLPCVGLHALAICYCSAYLTDGVVPRGQVARLVGDVSLLLPEGHAWNLVANLVDAGLWEHTEEFSEGDERKYEGDYRIHDYLDYNPSREQVMQLREKRGRIGRRGGLAKAKANLNTSPSKRVAKRKQKPTPSPSPSRLESTTPLSPSSTHAAPTGFVRFWAEYPRKVGQPRALKAWGSLHLDNGLLDPVLQGLTRWRAYWVRQQTPSDRIPYPATWLNDRRWEDDTGGQEEIDEYAKFPRN